MSQPRGNQIVPVAPAADLRGEEGKFVRLDSGALALHNSATVAPFGVLVEGSATTGKSSVALPGVSGTVRVKVTGTSPGSIVNGSFLTVKNDGTVHIDSGTGNRVRVAQALEAGAADELIEARLVEPAVLS